MQPAENVKAGVVERGNGMKYADAYGFQRRMIPVRKPESSTARPHPSKHSVMSRMDLTSRTMPFPFSIFMASRTSKRLFETYAFACYQNETDAYRSNAQTADLDEQGNDCTPEHGEMIRRVDGDEPCNTDRAGGSEQCINGGALRAVSNEIQEASAMRLRRGSPARNLRQSGGPEAAF